MNSTKTIVVADPTEAQQERIGSLVIELSERFEAHLRAVLVYHGLLQPGHYRALAEAAADLAALLESLPKVVADKH